MTASFDHVLAALPALTDHPRVDLFQDPTPLRPMTRTSDALGLDIDIKRDDLLPLAMGGNKVRQLEFYLGQAHAQGADTVLITGAIQSNFVRLCAAAARQLGWHPVVQLEDRVPKDDPAYNNSGNVLLLKMLGAEVHRFPEGENEAAADANLDQLAAGMRAKGAAPYVIHLGIDHPPYGGLGYVAAAVETFLQYKARGGYPDAVFLPSGSGLTHAGFLVGARAVGWDVPVFGICVRRDADQQKARITRRAGELSDMLGGVALSDRDVQVSDAVLPPGYGQMNSAVAEAIQLAAQSDAILLDPVYSGRTFAGLLNDHKHGRLNKFGRVLFVHTGGTPAIFAYQSELGI